MKLSVTIIKFLQKEWQPQILFQYRTWLFFCFDFVDFQTEFHYIAHTVLEPTTLALNSLS